MAIRIGSQEADVRRLREDVNDLSGEAKKAREKQIATILEDKARDITELQKAATQRVASTTQAQQAKQKEVDQAKRAMDEKQREIEQKKREIEEQQEKIKELMRKKAELERESDD